MSAGRLSSSVKEKSVRNSQIKLGNLSQHSEDYLASVFHCDTIAQENVMYTEELNSS